MKKKQLSLLICGIIIASSLAACGNASSTAENAEIATENNIVDDTTAESKSEEDIDTKETTSVSDDSTVTDLLEIEETAAAVVINDQIIELGTDMASILDVIGEPDSYEESESCLGAGFDKDFYYGAICIKTSPNGEKDEVYAINLEESASLPNGITVGESSSEDIKAIYSPITEDGSYIEYESDESLISFEIDSETNNVIYIEMIKY